MPKTQDIPPTEHEGLIPLRGARLARGWSIRELARRAEVDSTQLSRIERGEEGLSLPTLYRLSRALGLPELRKQLRPWIRDGAGE